MSNDPVLDRLNSYREICAGLMSENAKLRGALLVIREHKLPYPRLSFDLGSNGVRDFFIKVADEALE